MRMFTGIVEEMGAIRSIRRGAHSAVLSIGAEAVLSDLKIGDSVAVNGVCLTATAVDGGGFTADVMHETLHRSSLGALAPGSPVNLERAMAAGGRFGGHIVSGHIDGTGTITEIAAGRQRRVVHRLRRPVPAAVHRGEGLHRHRRHQPDGGVGGGGPVLRLRHPPHGGGDRAGPKSGRGTSVNLETDIIGKYVEKLLRPAADTSPQGRHLPGIFDGKRILS